MGEGETRLQALLVSSSPGLLVCQFEDGFPVKSMLSRRSGRDFPAKVGGASCFATHALSPPDEVAGIPPQKRAGQAASLHLPCALRQSPEHKHLNLLPFLHIPSEHT